MSKPVKIRKKISVKNVKLSDMEEGYTFSGKYIGLTEGQPFNVLDEKTGEIMQKTLKSAVFESENGERTAYLADRGLEGALRDSMVTPGNNVEIVKLAKVKLTKGRTMNQYDVYLVE